MADSAKGCKRQAKGPSSGHNSDARDPLEGSSGQVPLIKKGKKTSSASALPTPSREEQRRHKAMERAFTKASLRARPISPERPQPAPSRPGSINQEEIQSVRDLSPDRPPSLGPGPHRARNPFFKQSLQPLHRSAPLSLRLKWLLLLKLLRLHYQRPLRPF